MKSSQEEEKESYYTTEGVCVTKRIEGGQTSFFLKQKDAEKCAEKKHSYVYDIFDSPYYGKRKQIGYGVPN